MEDKCNDCRHCQEGYCVIYEQKVNPSKKSCPDFEEN